MAIRILGEGWGDGFGGLPQGADAGKFIDALLGFSSG